MGKKYSTTINIHKSGRSNSKVSKKGLSKSKRKDHGKYKIFGNWRGLKNHRETKSKQKSRLDNLKLGKNQTKTSYKTSIFSKFKGKKSKKARKILISLFTIIFIFLFIGTMAGLAYMQNLTKDLPDPEKPFDNPKFKVEASVMYDRNGKELYRLFGDDNRDILKLKEDQKLDDIIPPELKWSILAAEDIDFYKHPGFDVSAIARCGIKWVTSGEKTCGGSTITQQVIKIASLEDNTRSFERKLRELVLSLQLENKVKDKDKILLLYMNLVSEGGNIYGVNTAAKYYYSKDVNDLSLEEAVILAAVPNNPALLSPIRSVDPERGNKELIKRTNYIYDQLLKYKDYINEQVKKSREEKAKRENRDLTEEENQDFITEEKIKAAKEKEVEYKDYAEDIKAPHFVFFARDLLTKRGYNNGEPFSLNQINTGGYKIYTTLDLDMHEVALDVVQNVGVNQYGARYGNKNAALMTMVPKTGEILTMVGSKCYNNHELSNCSSLDESQGDQFDPQVNILTTDQQPGSSIKPFVYYKAYEQGLLAPSSQMADIPIELNGGKYKPKNSDGRFSGIHPVRYMIAQSRNIPAVSALVALGPDKLANLKSKIGYSRNIDPATYGPSAALGSQDVYAVEHANAYGTLANGGKYVPYEAILKIVDRNGKEIYRMGSQEEGKDYREAPKQVLNEKAAFMINDSTNPNSDIVKNVSPVKWKDNRDMSGKTGTSENNRDTWFVNYSPDFVTVGWSGNNDNTRMAGMAFGSTNTEPWVREFMIRVADSKYFKARTPYNKPDGVIVSKICSKITINGKEKEACEGGGDYVIQGNTPPVYVTKKVVEVCVDQQDKLARDIDKNTGNSIEKEFQYIDMIGDNKELQDSLDKYLQEKQGGNGGPKEGDYCTINRSPNGELPWAVINSPIPGSSYSDTFLTNVIGYSANGSVTKLEILLAGQSLKTLQTNSFMGDLSVPSGLVSGNYEFIVKVTDSKGKTGSSSVNINIKGIEPNINLNAPSNGSIKPLNTSFDINISYDSPLTGIQACILKPDSSVECIATIESSGTATASYTPTNPGEYQIWAKATNPSVYESPKNTISVN